MYLPLLILLTFGHRVISQTTECDVDCVNATSIANDEEFANNTEDVSNHTSEISNTTVKQAVIVKKTNDTVFLAKPLDPETKILDQLDNINLNTYEESDEMPEESNATQESTKMYKPKAINSYLSILQQLPINLRGEFVQQLPLANSFQGDSENMYTPTPRNMSQSIFDQLLGKDVPVAFKYIKNKPKKHVTTPEAEAGGEESAPFAEDFKAGGETPPLYSTTTSFPTMQAPTNNMNGPMRETEKPSNGRVKIPTTRKHPRYQKRTTTRNPEEENLCDVEYSSLLNVKDNLFYLNDNCGIKQFAFNDGSVGPQKTPDIGKLDKNKLFSINNPDHMKEMKQLMEIFLKCNKLSDFKNAALYYKPRVNSMLYTFAFSSSILYRKDTQSFSVPGLYNVMPDHFFNAATISEGKNVIERSQVKLNLRRDNQSPRKFKINKVSNDRTSEIFNKNKNSILISESNMIPISAKVKKHPRKKSRKAKFLAKTPVNVQRNDLPKENVQAVNVIDPYLTGSYKNPERRVSYFREDIAANSHHWHWHLVYANHLPDDIIPNRKGELFYYMHNQMLRRYDAERLASKLAFVIPIVLNKNEPIKEGYYPHLASDNTRAHFSGRPEHLLIQDINNPVSRNYVKIETMLHWKQNIKQAIKDGYMQHRNGSRILLNNVNGIDFLGAAIEASNNSVNTDLYGELGLHNAGHIVISNLHDPEGRFNAHPGVMCATETALRDPAFWRWHKMIDDIFTEHKSKLPSYTDNDLSFPDITIKEMKVITRAQVVPGIQKQRKYQTNELGTFFKSTTMDMSRAIDFQSEVQTAKIRVYHLDHHRFIIKLMTKVTGVEELEGQVRIFISPRHDPQGKKFKDHELYKHAIEMDRFPVFLKPGMNIIERDSRESAVTMAPKRQWTILSDVNQKFIENEDLGSFCGCGWPDHLLLPKGTKNGIKYAMFVMISDRSKEKVVNNDDDGNEDDDILRTCEDSLTMCGLIGRKFPDLRAMGFPLDRPMPNNAKNWFKRSNMILHDITIYQDNEMNNIYNPNNQ